MLKLHTVQSGANPDTHPTIVLSHALGCSHAMWDGVASALANDFCVLRYDARGHGASADANGAYTIDDMADDAAELIKRLARGAVHFCGLSMGGMVAQSLASRYPTLVNKLIISNSAGYYDDAGKALWAARIEMVLSKGIEPILEPSMQRWFTPDFIANNPDFIAVQKELLLQNKPGQYALACAAVGDIDFRSHWQNIKAPTLLIAGELDVATPPSASSAIAAQVPNATMQVMAGAAHIPALEMPQAYAGIVKNFLIA